MSKMQPNVQFEAALARFAQPSVSAGQQAQLCSAIRVAPHPLRVGLVMLALSLSACTHTPHAMPAKESVMITPDNAAASSATLVAEDAGKRFLKLIERLNAGDALSLGALAEIMGIPVAQMEPRHNGFSAAVAIDDHWSYALELWQESASGPWAAINLQFDHADDREYADFSPVCGMTLAAYRETFKASGYSEKLDHDASGRLLAASYATDRMFIILKPGMKSADDKSTPSCIRRIELMNRANGG